MRVGNLDSNTLVCAPRGDLKGECALCSGKDAQGIPVPPKVQAGQGRTPQATVENALVVEDLHADLLAFHILACSWIHLIDPDHESGLLELHLGSRPECRQDTTDQGGEPVGQETEMRRVPTHLMVGTKAHALSLENVTIGKLDAPQMSPGERQADNQYADQENAKTSPDKDSSISMSLVELHTLLLCLSSVCDAVNDYVNSSG